MKQCIFCGTTSNLNSSMTVSVDDNKVIVDICDEHAEEATIKTVKTAYVEKQEKIRVLLEQAKALGLNINTNQSGIVVVSNPNIQEATTTDDQIKPQILQAQPDEDMVPTNTLNKIRVISTSGAVSGSNIGKMSGIDTNDLESKLPSGVTSGSVRLEESIGKDGVPIVFQAKRVDGTGTTCISINRDMNDNKLQERTKRMAASETSMSNYDNATRTCPLCRGSGTITHLKKDIQCPKCKGLGLMTL